MTQQTRTCTAVFRWLQKDAYKETAGRSSAQWPPHTTTTLRVECTSQGQTAPEVVADVFMENYGTKPGATDANGDVILVEVAQNDAIEGSRSDLLQLVAEFQKCSCSSATQFLSMDALQEPMIALKNNRAAEDTFDRANDIADVLNPIRVRNQPC